MRTAVRATKTMEAAQGCERATPRRAVVCVLASQEEGELSCRVILLVGWGAMG
jgi:hypothetical protein